MKLNNCEIFSPKSHECLVVCRVLIKLIVCVLIGITITFGQTENLADKTFSFDVCSRSLNYVLAILVQDHDIRLGMERGSTSPANQSICINAKDKKLSVILDSITTQAPEYDWKISEDVVNLFPRQGAEKFLHSFLDLHITKIVLPEHQNDEYSFVKLVLQLPEVKGLMEKESIKPASIIFYSPSPAPMFVQRKGDIAFANLSIREILNKIVLTGNHKSWSVDLVGAKHNQLLLSF